MHCIYFCILFFFIYFSDFATPIILKNSSLEPLKIGLKPPFLQLNPYFVLFGSDPQNISVADPEIFISGGPLTDLRGDPLQSRFSDSLYKQPFFFQKRGAQAPAPLNPPLYLTETRKYIIMTLIRNIETKPITMHHCFKDKER